MVVPTPPARLIQDNCWNKVRKNTHPPGLGAPLPIFFTGCKGAITSATLFVIINRILIAVPD
jgi:hypothetical protein